MNILFIKLKALSSAIIKNREGIIFHSLETKRNVLFFIIFQITDYALQPMEKVNLSILLIIFCLKSLCNADDYNYDDYMYNEYNYYTDDYSQELNDY